MKTILLFPTLLIAGLITAALVISASNADDSDLADDSDHSAHDPTTISLDVADGWSPLAPPGRMMAGFMALHNLGDASVRLVSGESERFGHIEIHTMTMDDGVMRMRKLEHLEIPPGETVKLQPGGLHLMLMQPKGKFELGEQFDLALIDDQGKRFPITLEVRERRARR